MLTDNYLTDKGTSSTSMPSPQGTISSASSSSLTSSLTSYLEFIKVELPNGDEITKRIDVRKAAYDILIELAAGLKLQPSNYTLQLFNENLKPVDYRPTQSISQINPHLIKIIPKSSTLKPSSAYNISANTNSPMLRMSPNVNGNSVSHANANKASAARPFEVTIRVQVNLPHNQKTTVRVVPDIKLRDLFKVICDENSMSADKYTLILKNNPIFDKESHHMNISNNMAYLNNSLSHYDTNEVTLIYSQNATNTTTPTPYTNKKQNFTQIRDDCASLKSFQSHLNRSSGEKSRYSPSVSSRLSSNEVVLMSRCKSELDLQNNDENNNNSNQMNQNYNTLQYGQYNTMAMHDDESAPKTKRKSGLFNFLKKKKPKSKSSLNVDEINEARSQKSSKENENYERKNDDTISMQCNRRSLEPADVKATNSRRASLISYNLNGENVFINKNKRQAPPPPSNAKPLVVKNVCEDSSSKIDKRASNENLAILMKTITAHKKAAPRAPSVPPAQEHVKCEKEKVVEVVKTPEPEIRITPVDANVEVKDEKIVESEIKNNESFEIKKSDSNVSISGSKKNSAESSLNTSSNSELSEVQEAKAKEEVKKSPSSSDKKLTESSDEDLSLSKSLAMAIKAAEEFVAQEDSNKQIKEEIENNHKAKNHEMNLASPANSAVSTPISPANLTKYSAGIKAYNGAIVDKNTTLNSEDDLIDVEQHINCMHEESEYVQVNTTSLNESSLATASNSSLSKNAFNKSSSSSLASVPVISTGSTNLIANCDELKEESLNSSSHSQSMTEISQITEATIVNKTVNETIKCVSENSQENLTKQSEEEEDERELKSSPSKVVFRKAAQETRNVKSASPKLKAQEQLQQTQSSPATTENHETYKVIRSSEVYEKNGAYYSNVGTIRGISGAVRKITTSKILSEIFNKPLENGEEVPKSPTVESPTANTSPQLKQAKSPVIESPQSTSPSQSMKQSIKKHEIQIVETTSPKMNSTKATKADEQLNSFQKTHRNLLSSIIANEKKHTNIPNALNQKPAIVTFCGGNTVHSRNPNLNNTAAVSNSNNTNSQAQAKVTTEDLKASIAKMSLNNDANANNNSKEALNFTKASLQPTQPQNKVSTSFVMSAKQRIPAYLSHNQHTVNNSAISNSNNNTNASNNNANNSISIRESLLNEIKKIVPRVEAINENNQNNNSKSQQVSEVIAKEPTKQELKPIQQTNTNVQQEEVSKKQPAAPPCPPPLAPKNFTIKTLNNKQQVVQKKDNRDDLLDSIKTFKFSSLRKISDSDNKSGRNE